MWRRPTPKNISALGTALGLEFLSNYVHNYGTIATNWSPIGFYQSENQALNDR